MTSITINPIEHIETAIAPLQTEIATHPLIQQLGDINVLRYFMRQHIFVVWDFVNLIKTLHSRLTRTQAPWLPANDPEAVRLLYEILIEEETDIHPTETGRHISHLDLYLDAMQHGGADTAPFKDFLNAISALQPVEVALKQPAILPCTRAFVLQTLGVCHNADLPTLAAYFVFGREAMVPHLFKPWLAQLEQAGRPATAPLIYYLKRHISLDGDVHFPKAARMLTTICGDDPDRWQMAEKAAKEALEARLTFLDGIDQSSPA